MASVTSKGSIADKTNASTITLSSVALTTGDSLIVAVSHDPATVSGVTWNGVSLSKDVEATNGGNCQGSIWSLHGVTGATGNIVVTFSSSIDAKCLGAVSLNSSTGMPFAFDVGSGGTGSGSSHDSGNTSNLSETSPVVIMLSIIEGTWGTDGTIANVHGIARTNCNYSSTNGGNFDTNNGQSINRAILTDNLKDPVRLSSTDSTSADWCALVAAYKLTTGKKVYTTQDVELIEYIQPQVNVTQVAKIIEYVDRPQISVTSVQKVYELQEFPPLSASPPAMRPTLRILRTADFLPIIELDEFESLTYTRRWVDLDDFDLVLSADTVQGAALRAVLFPSDGSSTNGQYLLNVSYDGMNDFTGFIDRMTVSRQSGNHKLNLKGNGLDRIFSDRILMPANAQAYDSYSGAAETVIKSMVDRHLVHPITTGATWGSNDPQRAVSQIIIATDRGRGETVTFEGRFQQLINGMSEVSRMSYDMGFGLTLVGTSLLFDCSEGVDKTQTVRLSIDLDNIESIEYDRDALSYASHVLMAGQGEDTARVCTFQYADPLKFYIERRETFEDARDLDTIAKLQDRGQAKLREQGRADTVKIKRLPVSWPYYKSDFDLGDIVSITDSLYGINQQCQIYEVTCSLAAGKLLDLDMTLNKPKKKASDAIRQVALSASSRT